MNAVFWVVLWISEIEKGNFKDKESLILSYGFFKLYLINLVTIVEIKMLSKINSQTKYSYLIVFGLTPYKLYLC